jgi:hypothetical protein
MQNKIKLITLFFCVLGLSILSSTIAYAQEPPPECPECVLINPKPGVVAPSQNGLWINGNGNSSANTTPTVTDPSGRGGGDAYFWWSPITDYTTGESRTWLNPGQSKHTTCAYVIEFKINGSYIGNDYPGCPRLSAGQETFARVVDYTGYGSSLWVSTEHSLSRTGFYWHSVDFDNTTK